MNAYTPRRRTSDMALAGDLFAGDPHWVKHDMPPARKDKMSKAAAGKMMAKAPGYREIALREMYFAGSAGTNPHALVEKFGFEKDDIAPRFSEAVKRGDAERIETGKSRRGNDAFNYRLTHQGLETARNLIMRRFGTAE